MTDVSEIFMDVATGASENAPARTGRHRTHPMTIVLNNTTANDLPLPRGCRGAMRFPQLPRAVVTTDFDGLSADFDFEAISIQLAVASCTSRFNHNVALPCPKSRHKSSRP
jgi:hypothetical protein